MRYSGRSVVFARLAFHCVAAASLPVSLRPRPLDSNAIRHSRLSQQKETSAQLSPSHVSFFSSPCDSFLSLHPSFPFSLRFSILDSLDPDSVWSCCRAAIHNPPLEPPSCSSGAPTAVRPRPISSRLICLVTRTAPYAIFHAISINPSP